MSDQPGLSLAYIGIAALFGRLVDVNELSSEDRMLVERAFTDVNRHLKKSNSGTTFARASGGGYAAFREN